MRLDLWCNIVVTAPSLAQTAFLQFSMHCEWQINFSRLEFCNGMIQYLPGTWRVCYSNSIWDNGMRRFRCKYYDFTVILHRDCYFSSVLSICMHLFYSKYLTPLRHKQPWYRDCESRSVLGPYRPAERANCPNNTLAHAPSGAWLHLTWPDLKNVLKVCLMI